MSTLVNGTSSPLRASIAWPRREAGIRWTQSDAKITRAAAQGRCAMTGDHWKVYSTCNGTDLVCWAIECNGTLFAWVPLGPDAEATIARITGGDKRDGLAEGIEKRDDPFDPGEDQE
jgi:hypothetical protein